MTDRRSDHFPRMTLRSEDTIRKQETLEGFESVEEYLARGGKIQQVEPHIMKSLEFGRKLTRDELLNHFGKKSYERRIGRGDDARGEGQECGEEDTEG